MTVVFCENSSIAVLLPGLTAALMILVMNDNTLNKVGNRRFFKQNIKKLSIQLFLNIDLAFLKNILTMKHFGKT